MEPENKTKIIKKVIEDEIKQAYIDYAMSVIISRALPDVRDGLKPVHRRILVAMNDLSLYHNKHYRKCAKVCGDVSGNYHPHGESIVYPSLVRMAQDFSLRYPLIDGQGNFGSVDGDPPAAMRYCECRMKRLAENMLTDLEKDTVDFVPNYDGTLKEPVVLPSKFPNLLVNGSSGIAVGMATNIPPHNIIEIVDALITLIDNPEIEIHELIKIVKGPDFPTAGIIAGVQGIIDAYTTGRGKIKVKAKSNIEDDKIIITEIPYQVNKALLIEQIAELTKIKKIEGIRNLRDESDREGIRVVIELKQNIDPNVVLNQLYKYTKMKVTFGIILLVLTEGVPKVLPLKELMSQFISHRKEVVIRTCRFDLKKAKERQHILDGLITALLNIDDVIKNIKASKTSKEAAVYLQQTYNLTEIQSAAILEMKLAKLASLEQESIKNEHQKIKERIQELESILQDKQKVLNIIKEQLEHIKEKYGDERKTQIDYDQDEDLDMEDLIEEQKMIITITENGYVKRHPTTTYRMQKRGGKGIKATGTKEEDIVKNIFVASTHSYLLCFTDQGKVHWLKVYKIPESSRQSQGLPIINLIEISKGERVTAIIPLKDLSSKGNLVMTTRLGQIKKTPLTLFSNPRKKGIRAISLNEKDKLISVKLVETNQHVIIATKGGYAIRFNEKDIRSMGRGAIGVRGIRLRQDDSVVGTAIANEQDTLLTVTEKGYGKKTKVDEYRITKRGGKGIKNLKITDKNGSVAAIKTILEEDNQLILISKGGIAIRIGINDVPTIGRATQGVRIMRLKQEDLLVNIAKVLDEEKEEEIIDEEINQETTTSIVNENQKQEEQETNDQENEEQLIQTTETQIQEETKEI